MILFRVTQTVYSTTFAEENVQANAQDGVLHRDQPQTWISVHACTRPAKLLDYDSRQDIFQPLVCGRLFTPEQGQRQS